MDCKIVAALIASACLIVCAVSGATGIIYIVDRPDLGKIQTMSAVPPEARTAVMGSVRWAGVGFLLGMIALLVSLGLSGWIRSRKIGMISSAFASVTLLLLLYFLGFVVRLL